MSRRMEDRFADVLRFAEALRNPTGAAVGPSGRSIAVLAFTYLGGTAEDEYFSDGISEEIINALAQVPGLRVVARTSSFAFKGKNVDLRRIGEQLIVATVLEGSVRRAGNRLRITAQLVDVRDGYHLWSERYDREMTDVFAIQDEIAAAVASRFKVATASPNAIEPDRRLTNNLEAYELYLKGRALQYKRGRWVLPARDCFARAVELDPNFADALAMMADSYRLLALNAVAPAIEVIPLAKAAAERALALDPTVAEAHAVLAAVTVGYDRDFALADRHWAEALRLNPDHVRALTEHALWSLIGVQQRFDEGLAEVERAVILDPLNAFVAGMHANANTMAGYHEAAQFEAARAVSLDPDSFVARLLQVEVLIAAGDYAGAIVAADAALLLTGRHPWILAVKAVALGLAGDRPGACFLDIELRMRARSDFVSKYALAASASATGNLDKALRLAERSFVERELMAVMGRNYPDWVLVRRHPGFPALLARMGFGTDT
jgi:serine/threonine-protein kinase